MNQPKGSRGKTSKSKNSFQPTTNLKKPLLLAKAEKVPTSIAQEKKVSTPKKPIIKQKAKKKKESLKSKQVSKVEPKKEEIKKEIPKKEVPKEEIKETPKAEEKNKELQDLKPTDTNVSETAELPEGTNIRYIGQAELDAMCIQGELSQAISQHWRPPVGIAKNKVCELTLVIDWQGKIKDIKVQKTSGAAMYDVSARQAALAAEYPKALWGKACTITFKPSLR